MKRNLNWTQNLQIINDFYDQHGYLPSSNKDTSSYNWLFCQKDSLKNGEILPQRAEILSKQPWYEKWIASQGGKANYNWTQTLDSINDFYHQHGRLPTQSESCASYKWLARQKALVKNGEMLPQRAETIASQPWFPQWFATAFSKRKT